MKIAILFMAIIMGDVLGWGSPAPKQIEPIPEPDLPAEVDPGTVAIRLTADGTVAQVARIARLKDVIARIINSKKFESRVLGAYYEGHLQFIDTVMANAEVLKTLRQGRELFSRIDYVWDLDVGVQRARCSTLGWTYPKVRMFWINSCGFDKRPDAGLAGTLCHEYTHKLGFNHSQNWTKSREHSVPYAIGTICAELYEEFKL
jgi:hypothetical protein